MNNAYLILADGTVFAGESFGAPATAAGELVFTTSVVGYLENLSDPAYAGQILLQTFPQIGNYGVIPADIKGKCRLAGYVVREWCDAPSNFRSEGDLDTFLRREGIPGIYGVDTRAITAHLRERGTMPAVLCADIEAGKAALRRFAPIDPMPMCGRSESATFPAAEEKYRVALIDYGCGGELISPLNARGCTVYALPYSVTAEQVLALEPDGVILSGGAGDPREYAARVQTAAALLGKVPMLGVGLGHQLLALATGAQVEKMKAGHRGANYPVRDLCGARTFITEQNHGYTVIPDTVSAGVIRYENANDRTCEGVDYPKQRAMSVQFCPTLGGSSQDAGVIFARFITLMGGDL